MENMKNKEIEKIKIGMEDQYQFVMLMEKKLIPPLQQLL